MDVFDVEIVNGNGRVLGYVRVQAEDVFHARDKAACVTLHPSFGRIWYVEPSPLDIRTLANV